MIKKEYGKKANGSYHAEPLMSVLPRLGLDSRLSSTCMQDGGSTGTSGLSGSEDLLMGSTVKARARTNIFSFFLL